MTDVEHMSGVEIAEEVYDLLGVLCGDKAHPVAVFTASIGEIMPSMRVHVEHTENLDSYIRNNEEWVVVCFRKANALSDFSHSPLIPWVRLPTLLEIKERLNIPVEFIAVMQNPLLGVDTDADQITWLDGKIGVEQVQLGIAIRVE